MMLLFIGLGVLIVGGIVWSCLDEYSEMAIAVIVVSSILLLILALVVPIARYDDKLDVAEYEAFVDSVEYARSNGDDIENTALQLKIVEYNAWIGRVKRMRETFWRFLNHPSVDDLVPLR